MDLWQSGGGQGYGGGNWSLLKEKDGQVPFHFTHLPSPENGGGATEAGLICPREK